jgi:hypothetical protein
MSYSPLFAFDLVGGLVYLLLLASVLLVVVVLVRLMLAATRALNAVADERDVRVRMLLAEDARDRERGGDDLDDLDEDGRPSPPQ